MLGNVDAADLHRAAGGPEDAGNHTEGGRFSGAVGSEKAEQLAAGNDEVDVIDRGELAVALGKMDQSDQAILRTMASTSSRSASAPPRSAASTENRSPQRERFAPRAWLHLPD